MLLMYLENQCAAGVLFYFILEVLGAG